MSYNRKQILEILAAGKINVDEAERLLSAVGESEPLESGGTVKSGSVSSSSPPRAKPKYLRVSVTSQEGAGHTKVNVRVPIQLLRAGVRLTSFIPESAQAHINAALGKGGVEFDLRKIKPEDLDDLVDHLMDLSVDVDDHDDKIRIFCE